MKTRDLRVEGYRPLIPPAILLDELPLTETGSRTVASAREELVRILDREDDRLIVVVGPCSVHDVEAATEVRRAARDALEGSRRGSADRHARVLREARTTVGWKGLINDPGLDGSFRINDGLRLARRLLLDLAELGVPRAVSSSIRFLLNTRPIS
jgi:3-deoxy-7-phosphoheptulonate synthase